MGLIDIVDSQRTYVRLLSCIIFLFAVLMCSQQLKTWENMFLIRYNGDFDSIADLRCIKESPTKPYSTSFTCVCVWRMDFYLMFIQTFRKSSCTWALSTSSAFFLFRKVDLTFTRHIFNETNVKRLLKTGIISMWSTDMPNQLKRKTRNEEINAFEEKYILIDSEDLTHSFLFIEIPSEYCCDWNRSKYLTCRDERNISSSATWAWKWKRFLSARAV